MSLGAQVKSNPSFIQSILSHFQHNVVLDGLVCVFTMG